MDIKTEDRPEGLTNDNIPQKSIKEILNELISPGKVIIRLTGRKNVCYTLDYIFSQPYDILKNVSGLSLEKEGLTQVVSYVSAAEQLKQKVLLGKTFKTNISSYKLTNEHKVDLLEGFDGLDRRLKKVKVWGCDFVILEVDLRFDSYFEAEQTPFDNTDNFGIFASTAQALGMVPILQFKYDLSVMTEDESGDMFVNTMYRINKSLYDFDVQIDSLLISQLMKYPLKKFNYSVGGIAEALVYSLQRSLPPVVGGVAFFAEGSGKALSFLIDKMLKIIGRTPWPMSCGYDWIIPTVTNPARKNEIFKTWFDKEKSAIEMISIASKGELFAWKPKATGITEEFIKSHDYSSKLCE